MSLCKKCQNKTCLKTGRPCPQVEKKLTKMTVGKLPNTISLNNNYLDEVILYDKDINKGWFKKSDRRSKE